MVQNVVARTIQKISLVADIVESAEKAVGLGHQRSVSLQEYGGRRKAKLGHFRADPGGQMRCPTHIKSNTYTSTAWYPLGIEHELSIYCSVSVKLRFLFLHGSVTAYLSHILDTFGSDHKATHASLVIELRESAREYVNFSNTN